MLLMFATPLFFAFGNLIMPLQIGSPDVAFPRLNAFSFWLFLFGSLDRRCRASSPPAARPTSAGRPTPRCPPASTPPASAATCGSAGLAVSGLGTILGARQLHRPRSSACARPGMTMFRMPIFTWNTLITSLLVLRGLPDPDRRADGAAGRPATSAPSSTPTRWAARCCGSTCSGSSAIPRSTSSRCRSSASSPRSSRCSAASRCSATRAWSARPSRSASCRSRSGRTTCSPPARCCCRSSRS